MRKPTMLHAFLIVTAALVSGLSLDGCAPRKDSAPPSFAGRQACASCHEKEHRLWTGSDHALGLLQARQRRYPDAVAEFGKASSLAPDNPRYAYVYAIALNGAGKPPAALRVLGEAYRRHPYDREVLLGLASILRDQGRAKEATKYGEERVAVMPENAEATRLLEECARSRQV